MISQPNLALIQWDAEAAATVSMNDVIITFFISEELFVRKYTHHLILI